MTNKEPSNNQQQETSSTTTTSEVFEPKHVTSHRSDNINSLAYRPEFVEGQDDTNKQSLTEFGNKVNDQIEKMQEQREGWRALLQKLYEEDNAQDDKVRELRRQVMLGEAEAMANPTFHRWIRDREQHGVGSEKIDSWYTIESLLPHTPYLCTIPCPRNLSEKGWELVEETVEDLFGEGSEESFSIEWWPLLQHRRVDDDDDSNKNTNNESDYNTSIDHQHDKSSSRRQESQTCISCSSKKGALREAFEANPKTLQRALIETPCFLIGDKSTTERLSSPFSTPLVIYVVRGSLIAVEPYYHSSTTSTSNKEQQQQENNNNTQKVKFPSQLAPTVITQQVTSSNCKALLNLRHWVESVSMESLPERSYAGIVMMTCLSSDKVSFSLLNMCPLDAVGSALFAWSDLVGLIVNAQNKRDQTLSKYRQEHDSEITTLRSKIITMKEEIENMMKRNQETNNDTSVDGEDPESANIANSNNFNILERKKKQEECDELVAEYDDLMNPLLPAPSIEVIFRGSWMKCDPADDACVKNILAGMELNSRREQHNNNNNNNNECSTSTTVTPASSSSATSGTTGMSTSTMVALAAGACVASASIGITLGLKLAAGNKK